MHKMSDLANIVHFILRIANPTRKPTRGGKLPLAHKMHNLSVITVFCMKNVIAHIGRFVLY